jgi:hypothetical protein
MFVTSYYKKDNKRAKNYPKQHSWNCNPLNKNLMIALIANYVQINVKSTLTWVFCIFHTRKYRENSHADFCIEEIQADD